MSDELIETEWESTLRTEWEGELERAAAISDKEEHYGICEMFLDRAVMHIAGQSADCSRLVAVWYARDRSDEKCGDMALRMMPVLDELVRPIIEIIAGFGVEDDSIDPKHVGAVCSEFIYNLVRHRVSVYIACASDKMNNADSSESFDVGVRAAKNARNNERRLQIMDVIESIRLFERAIDEDISW